MFFKLFSKCEPTFCHWKRRKCCGRFTRRRLYLHVISQRCTNVLRTCSASNRQDSNEKSQMRRINYFAKRLMTPRCVLFIKVLLFIPPHFHNYLHSTFHFAVIFNRLQSASFCFGNRDNNQKLKKIFPDIKELNKSPHQLT